MSTPSRKVSLSSSSSSLVNSLARRFDPHALKHQGPGPSISSTPITTDRSALSGDNRVSPEGQDDMHRKFDFLSQKIEQLLTAQDKVLKTLGRVSHDVDGITKSMTTSKIEKEGPACEVRREDDHLETKMLCLEMNQALSEMNKRTEQQVKRMDGMEQVVQGVQQFISFLAEKLKTSKIMEVLLNGPATSKAKPAKEVRTPKGDKAKKAGRGQTIADKKDVLPNKRKEKVSRDHKVKEKKEKSYLCLKGTHSLKKKPPDSAERFTQKLQACSHKLKKDNAEKAIDLSVQSSGLNVLTTGQKEQVEALAFTNQVEQSTPYISDDSDEYILHEEETSDQEGTTANESDHIDLVHAAEDVEGIKEDEEVEGSTEELEGEKTADNEVQSRSSGTPAQEEELKSAVVFDKKEQHEDCLPEDQHTTSSDETQIPSYSTTDTKDQEITPPDVIFEGGNLNCTVLLERYDEVGQEISLLLTVDNDVDREFSETPEQNCQLEHSGSSSKRRVTEDDSIKDDKKKSRVDKELSPVDSTDEIREPSHALFIQAADSGDAESTGGHQQDLANEDNDDEFEIVECPAQAAPFGHRIVSARHAQINNHYIVNRSEIIGGGRFGQVYLCTENLSGLTLAAKVIKAKFLKQKEEVKNEINVMNQLNHSNLIQLYDAFESKNDIVLVMEYIAGGELFDRIIDETYRLTEMDTILFIKQICEGIQYMHQMYIIHLDLKPENILCVNRATNQIKIIDFGLARRYKPREKLKVHFGTPEFLAPEVVNYEFVSFPTDMWSIGVIAYMLLSGLSPFMGEDDNETMNNIICCRWGFENDEFQDVSEDAKDFITKLLIKDKSWRISAKESLKHRWLCDSELHSRLGLQRKTKGSAVSQAPMSQ